MNQRIEYQNYLKQKEENEKKAKIKWQKELKA